MMDSQVYIINIKDINVNIDNLFNQLPDYCKNKLKNCNNVELKKIRVIAWNILSEILSRYYNINLINSNIYENKYGKPYIDDIYFNITHSRDYVGIIISKLECGIDLEKKELNVDVNKFARKILSVEELDRNDINLEYLILKWTKIEAYYKTIGRGIVLSKLKEKIDYSIIESIDLGEYCLSFSPKTNKIYCLDICKDFKSFYM